MNIRKQTLLAIVPLFALLTIAGNGAAYYMETRAVRRGLEEEAGTIAVTIAAFFRPSDLAALRENRYAESRLAAAMSRLDRWGILHGLVIWDASGRVILRRPEGARLPPSPHAFGDRPFINSPLLTEEDGLHIAAYAALRGGSGAVVGVETEANLYAEEISRLRRRSLARTGIVVLLGAGIALLLSALIRRDIRRLGQAATRIESGDFVPPTDGLVREVTELGQTFGVLSSVIEEVRTKSQRALVENERFRTADDLLATYRLDLHAPVPPELAGRRVAIAAVGVNHESCFHVAGTKGDRGYIIFGRVDGERPLDTASLVSAVQHELRDRLGRGEAPDLALAATARLFPLSSGTALAWSRDAAPPRRWSLAPDGTVVSAPATIVGGAGLSLAHDLPTEFATASTLYLQRFSTGTPAELLADLSKLAGESPGTLALVAPA